MGHFGKRPIRFAWFALVLPALLLELLRPGRAAADESGGGGAAILPPGAGLGTAPARRARDCGRDHRLSGTDFRSIFADPAGRAAGLLPPTRHPAHVALRDGAGLRAAGELGADGQHHCDRHRVWIVHRAGGGVRDSGDPDDGDHGGVAAGRGDRALALVTCRSLRRDWHLSHNRPGVFRRECVEDCSWWMAAAGDWRSVIYIDDDVEDWPPDRGRTPGGARLADRGLSAPSRRHPPGARSGHRCIHDGAAARRAACSRAQYAVQQSPS